MVQLHLQPGDVVMAHQKLPHRICKNYSPHIRYQVYFRLRAQGFTPEDAPYGGVWDAFKGVQPSAAQPAEEAEGFQLVATPPAT